MQSKLPLFFTVNLAATAVSASATAGEDKEANRKGMKTSESHQSTGLERPVASPIRLDAALAQIFPDMGVRGRRRFWEWCAIMVNGTSRAPGFMVVHGDEVGIVPQDSAYGEAVQSSLVPSGGAFRGATSPQNFLSAPPSVASTSSGSASIHQTTSSSLTSPLASPAALSASSAVPTSSVAPPVISFGPPSLNPLNSSNNSSELHGSDNSQDRGGDVLEEWLKAIQLVAMTPDYLVFYKPCGLHTAHVAGAGSVSLEACLPLFMERYGHNLEAVCLHQGGCAEGGIDSTKIGDEKLADGAVKEAPVDRRGVSKTQENQTQKMGTASTPLDKEPTPFSCPLLLTRLDFETSGLVLAARTPLAQETFRQWELEGKVEKTYLAVAWGKVGKGIVKNALNMKKRRQTAVLEHEGEATRWTAYTGVASFDTARFGEVIRGDKETGADTTTGLSREGNVQGGGGPDQPTERADRGACSDPKACDGQGIFDESEERAVQEDGKEVLSLVKVKIHRGARHQIRAHLAFMGYPLLGDALYGAKEGTKVPLPLSDLGEGYFFLHYGRLRMPGMTAWVLPDNRWARWLVQGRQMDFYGLLMGEG